MKNPLIFDIVRSSLVDGPGVRTTVFFKGCNLRCRWCHNPEGQDPRAQVAFFADKCVFCGVCERICTATGACELCGKCVESCVANARKIYGKEMSPAQITAIVQRDKIFYDATGGGVTFSGGECMLYPDFLAECASMCKKAGISVAIDTAGCVPFSSFEKVLPYADLFLYDIKCVTPETHREFTGADNALILENFEKLLSLGKEIIVRVPEIEGFNSGAERDRITRYLSDKNVKTEFLPYHEMGISKKAALENEKFFKKPVKNA